MDRHVCQMKVRSVGAGGRAQVYAPALPRRDPRPRPHLGPRPKAQARVWHAATEAA